MEPDWLESARAGNGVVDLGDRCVWHWWTVPAVRMKAQREHRVPLSQAAVELLRRLPHMEGSDVVFWGGRLRKPRDGLPADATGHISNMAMLELLRGMRRGLTVHGFRSASRDWAAEATAFPVEVVEMALAHTSQNQVEAAYRRGDLLDKRRELIQAWADYLGGKMVPGKRKKRRVQCLTSWWMQMIVGGCSTPFSRGTRLKKNQRS